MKWHQGSLPPGNDEDAAGDDWCGSTTATTTARRWCVLRCVWKDDEVQQGSAQSKVSG